MADQRINLTLGIGADTSKAKTEIQNLQKELNKLTSFNGGLKGLNYDKSLYNATAAVKEFQIHLQQATNVDTGKLDLSILSKSLKDSGKSLQDYAKSFKDLGPQGQQAFNSVTQAIMNAEVPLRRTNKLIQEMGISLKNTIKWQFSSSAVHAFMGAIQGAYGYVEDLNKSLNNIRIVTGRSADEMADFAKQANKAAKELSVSTTTYTDAALIYYQQGLDDEQVKQRTNTTVKMANVTGESATNVSSYMTAIWNNFDDGSKSLEYFGDVITALGAATAASSEEIAGGLEKFAAVGETVGLSYEYATAALTTIIDKTRQSEDVVGTALKTIFARIQGLQQGDTAEDGVTLNKYSAALANVGIQIMDTSGELKAMDEILNELGQRWQTLSKAEQVALAQTVGGTRQYTQLIALMDNWGAMQENLSTAYNSSGALEEQAEIYAESWEAAQQRVTTALQTIYQELLNDKFFIGVTDMVGGAIELFSKLIDTVGGLPGVLAISGIALTKLFKDEIPKSLKGLENIIKDFTGASKQEGYGLKEQALDINYATLNDEITDKDISKNMVNNTYASRKSKLLNSNFKGKNRDILESRFELEKMFGDVLIETSGQLDAATLVTEKRKEQTLNKFGKNKGNRILQDAQKLSKGEKVDLKKYENDAEAKEYLDRLTEAHKKQTEVLEKHNQQLKEYNEIRKENNKAMEAGENAEIEALKISDEQVKSAMDEKKALQTVEQGFISAGKAITSFTISISTVTGIIGVLNDDSMDLFEKIEAILPMLLVAIPSIVSTIKNATAATVLFNAEGQKGILIKTAELLLGADYNKELTKEAGLIPFLTILKEALNKSNKKGVIIKTADLVVTKLLDLAQKSLLLTFLAIAGAIAGVVAVGFILVKIWEALKNSSPEGQLKKANEELENSKKAAQEASNAYNDLKSSIDSLESAQNTLAGLTKGTLEWQQAVLKVNEQVLDLIDKYPELAQYMTNVDGVLGISKEGIEKITQQKLNEANSLNRAVLSDQRNVMEKESAVNNKISISGVDSYSATKVANNLTYNNDGSFNLEETLKKSGFENASEAFKNAILNNLESLERFKNNLDKTSSGIKNIDKTIAASWLQTHTDNSNSDINNFIATGMSNIIGDIKKEVEDEYDLSNYETKLAYAKSNLGPDASQKEINNYIEDLNKKIKDGEITLETIKESVISNIANYKAYNKTQDLIKDTDKYKNQEGYETLRNIIASGGDASSFNALNETEYNNFKEMAFDENGKLREEFKEMFSIFGEDFINTLENTFSKANEEKYKAESAENRERLYQQKVDETAKGLGVDTDALSAYASYLEQTNDLLKDNKEAALEAAAANIRWNNNIKKVSDVLSDNADALSESNRGTWEYFEAIGKVQNAVTDLLGIEISTAYVEEHLGDIQKAVEGDEEAIKKLQQTAAVDWAKTFAQNVQDVKDENGKLIFDASQWANEFTSAVEQAAQALGSLDTNVELTADASEVLNVADQSIASMIELANKAMEAGQMTEAQMRQMFGSMGYTPEVTYENVDQETVTSGRFSVGPFNIPYENKMVNQVKVPKISDANGDGKTSLTKISTAKSMGSSSSKKSGSGGGSKKDAKSAKDETERYHVIKEAIEDLGNELDSLGKKKDRAFGKNKLKLMDEEIAKLRDMEAAQKQYNKEIEEYYNKDKDAIAKYGAEFDENGIILNYEELIQEQVDKFNKLRTDKAEEEYQKFMDTLKQYEETHDLLEEEKEKLVDLQNQIYDAALEKIDYKVELQIEINSDDLEFLEFLLENLTDAAYDAADAIANLGQQTAEQLQNQEIYTQGINDIFAEHGLGSNAVDQFLNGSLTAKDLADMEFTEAEVETLRKYRDGLIETTRALINLREESWNKVMEAITALSDEFDKQADRVDHAIGVMDSYRNIIDIVGKDALGISDDMMKMFDETAVDTAMDALTVSKTKYDTLLEQYNITKKEYNAAIAAGNTEEAERLAEVLDGVEEEMQDAQNDMMSDWENALEKANQLFEENTKRILENFKDAMAGQFESLETLQDDFAKTRELDDMYVDDYKKIYELSKLTRDINRSMDETDNLAAKTALRDMQKEINDLQEAGVELSQYDLDHLRAKYELRLAEIALEDAQNAKSQVRMTRDSEGNWSYTYTADQDNIDNAQQNYEDKLYAIQELSTNYIKDLEEQILNLSLDMAEEIAAIDRTVYASEEAYNAEVQRITDFYKTKMNILSGEMDKAFANNQSLYDNDWRKYSEATGYKISADELFLTKFGETALGTKLGFDTMQGYQEAFNTAIGSPDTPGTLLGDLSQNYKDWQTKVDDVMKTAGTSMDTFKETASDVLEDTKKKTNEVADSMDNEKDPKGLKQKAKAAFEAALKAAQDFEKAYGPEIQKIIDKNTSLVTSLNGIFNMWGDIKKATDSATTAAKNYNQYAGGNNVNSVVKNNSGDDSKLTNNSNPTLTNKTPDYSSSWSGWSGANPDITSGWTLPNLRNQNGYYTVKNTNTGQTASAQRTGKKQDGKYQYKIVGTNTLLWFDTGGYTGEWGSSGRLAMLHEKELVLNADDTKNMFSIIDAVRDIVKSIDLNANTGGFGLGNLISAMIPSSESNLNQNVEIKAEFPNVTDRGEIEAAFDNLINKASQYANRK